MKPAERPHPGGIDDRSTRRTPRRHRLRERPHLRVEVRQLELDGRGGRIVECRRLDEVQAAPHWRHERGAGGSIRIRTLSRSRIRTHRALVRAIGADICRPLGLCLGQPPAGVMQRVGLGRENRGGKPTVGQYLSREGWLSHVVTDDARAFAAQHSAAVPPATTGERVEHVPQQVVVEHRRIERLVPAAHTGAGLPELDLGDGRAPGVPAAESPMLAQAHACRFVHDVAMDKRPEQLHLFVGEVVVGVRREREVAAVVFQS